MRNCVGAAACLSGLGSHTGRPRNKLSSASSSGLKRVMFSILFSCETSNQSAVDNCASVADWVVYGGDTANCYVCEPKYFITCPYLPCHPCHRARGRPSSLPPPPQPSRPSCAPVR